MITEVRMIPNEPPLETADRHRLLAAEGWLELGSTEEARLEMDAVSDAAARHPMVLEMRWLICVREADWETGLGVARQLCEIMPDDPAGWLHQAYSLRRVAEGGLHAAWSLLRPTLDRFPDEALIPYNLACYACQMKNLEEARQLIEVAMDRGGPEKIKCMALADTDLEELWDVIRRL